MGQSYRFFVFCLARVSTTAVSPEKKSDEKNVTFHRIGKLYLVLASVSLLKYLLCLVYSVHFNYSPVFVIYLMLLSRNFASSSVKLV